MPVYSDYTLKLLPAVGSIAPIKNVRVKANTKHLFDSELITEINKHRKLYEKYKNSGMETNMNNFRAARFSLQKTIQRKKK